MTTTDDDGARRENPLNTGSTRMSFLKSSLLPPRPPSSVPETQVPPSPSKASSPMGAGMGAAHFGKSSAPAWSVAHEARQTQDWTIVLRHRLNQLDYFEPFNDDAAPLVQKLLSDLIQTTETARKFKSQLDVVTQEKIISLEQVTPLKNEIIRLTSENNHLHQDIVKLADERDAKDSHSNFASRKLESQLSDLRFMVSQYAKRVEVEQRRADESRDRAESLMGKLGLFQQMKGEKAVSTAEKLFQRLQKIDVETGLEPLEQNPTYFSPPDPAIADMLKLSEKRIQELEQTRATLEARILDQENETMLLREQLSKRDREITRIGTQLEVSKHHQFGSTASAIFVPSSSDQKEDLNAATFSDLATARERLEQLEIQIEFLQDHNDALEKELSTFESDKKSEINAYKVNRDKMAEDLRLERERSDGLLQNLTQLQEMVKDLETLRGPSKLDAMAKDAAKTAKQLADVTQKLKDTQAKWQHDHQLLESSQRKNEKIASELERLRGGKAAAVPADQLQTLETKIKDLEAGRFSLASELDAAKSRIQQLTQSLEESSVFQAKAKVLETEMIAKHQEMAKLIQKVENMQEQYSGSHQIRMRLAEDFTQIQSERDQLVLAIEKLQSQLTQLQDHAEEIAGERDNLAGLHSQVTNELQILRGESQKAATSVNSPTLSPSRPVSAEPLARSFAVDNSSEKERIKELETLVDQLNRDLKKTVLSQRETGASANEVLLQLETEIEGLRKSMTDKDSEIQRLKDNMKSLENKATVAESEVKAYTSVIDSQKVKISQLEMEREKDRFNLREIKSKYSDFELQLQKHKSENTRLEQLAQDRLRQIEEQKELLSQIDKERDGVQVDLDTKAEAILELQDALKKIKSQYQASEQDANTKRDQLEVMTQHLNQQSHELSAMQKRINTIMKERDFLANETSRHAEEARNLGSDLSAVSRENQALNSELVQVAGERDRFKSELTECERQVQYLDELCRVKDQEKDHHTLSYRKLIADHEKLNIAVESSRQECDGLRMEIVMRDKRIQQFQQNINEVSAELNQYKIDLAAYEKQTSNLTRTLATSERTAKHLDMDKARLVREIQAARDLASNLERSKDEMTKNHTVLVLENEKLEHIVRNLEGEREALTNQLKAEKIKTEKLERMLTVERTRKMQTEKSAQDLAATRSSQDDALKTLSEQQTVALASMSRELAEAKQEVVTLKALLQQNELAMAKQEQASSELSLKLALAEDTIDGLKRDLQTKTLILRDLEGHSRPSGKGLTEVEKRVQSELYDTRLQLSNVQRNNKEDQRYQPEQSTMSFSPSDRSSSGPRSTSRGGEDNMVLMDPMSNNTTEVPLTLDLLQSNSHTSSTPRRSRRDTEVLEAIGQALNEYSRSATGSKDLS